MGNDTNAKFLLFQELLQRLAGEIEKLAIELGACEKLALTKGVSSEEIHQAKESALADPEGAALDAEVARFQASLSQTQATGTAVIAAQ